MKKVVCSLLLCACAVGSLMAEKTHKEIRKSSEYRDARLNGAKTQVLLHVRDDQDAPVADADVLVRMGHLISLRYLSREAVVELMKTGC